MNSNIKVFKLLEIAEKDFKAKGGEFELVLVLNCDGSVNAYHRNGKKVIQPVDATETRIHQGIDRVKSKNDQQKLIQSAGKQSSEKDQAKIKCHTEEELQYTQLADIVDRHDEQLTGHSKVHPHQAPPPANQNNILKDLQPISIARLNNSCYICGNGWCIYC